MKQVEILSEGSRCALEKSTNLWLKNHNDINVISLEYNDGPQTCPTIVIFYETNDIAEIE